MEYQKRSVNGDAGEYFAAYTVTKKLGWPCRLYGVDLGVDAELEVLDGGGKSSGDIIKIQVKAIDKPTSADEASIYVDDRHIEYWKKFCLPVIVCCVDLSSEQVYWKQITATEAFKSGGESRKVSFNLAEDKLTEASKSALQALVHPQESKQIDVLFQELKKRFGRLPNTNSDFYSFDALADADEKCISVEEVFSQLTPLLAYFPWRVSSYAQAEFSGMKNAVRILRNNMHYYHAVLVNGG